MFSEKTDRECCRTGWDIYKRRVIGCIEGVSKSKSGTEGCK